jgi:DNA-binding FrmR family transcriptional regulator
VVQPHHAALLKRFSRIEGQVRGVARMVEEQRYCVDILMQLAAIRSALDGAALQLLHDHARGCVATAIRSGRGEPALRELMMVVNQLTR